MPLTDEVRLNNYGMLQVSFDDAVRKPVGAQ